MLPRLVICCLHYFPGSFLRVDEGLKGVLSFDALEVALDLSHLRRGVLEKVDGLICTHGIYPYDLVVSHFYDVTRDLITVKLQASSAHMRAPLITTNYD